MKPFFFRIKQFNIPIQNCLFIFESYFSACSVSCSEMKYKAQLAQSLGFFCNIYLLTFAVFPHLFAFTKGLSASK